MNALDCACPAVAQSYALRSCGTRSPVEIRHRIAYVCVRYFHDIDIVLQHQCNGSVPLIPPVFTITMIVFHQHSVSVAESLSTNVVITVAGSARADGTGNRQQKAPTTWNRRGSKTQGVSGFFGDDMGDRFQRKTVTEEAHAGDRPRGHRGDDAAFAELVT